MIVETRVKDWCFFGDWWNVYRTPRPTDGVSKNFVFIRLNNKKNDMGGLELAALQDSNLKFPGW